MQMPAPRLKTIVPVILCGGSGLRLWPLSRADRPKQLLSLTGERTLLQETARRALDICGCDPEYMIAVTGALCARDAARQLDAIHPALTRQLLSEPSARNTGAAVALAALHAKDVFGEDALLLILPADHHIGHETALAEAVRIGVPAAEQGMLVTFGIVPSRADTGYGYINAGKYFAGHDAIRHIAQFVEKPDAATAQSYIDSGTCLWNSGIFLYSAGAVLTQFRMHAPDILAATDAAVSAGSAAHPDAALYAAIPALPFDKAVMERSGGGAVVPLDAGWSDIGSWDRLWDVRAKDEAGNACRGDVVQSDTKDCLIESLGGRLIACAGLRNIVVVDTGDTVLVADRTNTEAMSAVVEALKKTKK